MTVVAVTVDDKEIFLGKPVSMVMECDEDVPADALTIVFSVDKKYDEFKQIRLYNDETLIFNGIVDNQTFIVDSNGEFLKLNVRSMEAILLDNEALPQIYNLPSITTIFNRHIKPYGFLGIKGSSKCIAQEFTILKGMSEWDVLYKFCTENLNIYPKVTLDNYIDITGNAVYLEEPLTIGNKEGKVYRYSFEEDINRYNLISHINLRVKNEGAYSEVIKDENALNRGIKRKRYLNLVGGSNPTLSYGESKIKAARRNSYKLKLQIEGYVNAKVGMKVNLSDKKLGKINDLLVSKVKYRLNASKDTMEIILRKE